MVPGTGNGFPGTDGISREFPREIPGKEAITLVRFRLLFQSRVYGPCQRRVLRFCRPKMFDFSQLMQRFTILKNQLKFLKKGKMHIFR